jgi:hypothetical protein
MLFGKNFSDIQPPFNPHFRHELFKFVTIMLPLQTDIVSECVIFSVSHVDAFLNCLSLSSSNCVSWDSLSLRFQCKIDFLSVDVTLGHFCGSFRFTDQPFWGIFRICCQFVAVTFTSEPLLKLLAHHHAEVIVGESPTTAGYFCRNGWLKVRMTVLCGQCWMCVTLTNILFEHFHVRHLIVRRHFRWFDCQWQTKGRADQPKLPAATPQNCATLNSSEISPNYLHEYTFVSAHLHQFSSLIAHSQSHDSKFESTIREKCCSSSETRK